jgi:hypothetical protein
MKIIIILLIFSFIGAVLYAIHNNIIVINQKWTCAENGCETSLFGRYNNIQECDKSCLKNLSNNV